MNFRRRHVAWPFQGAYSARDWPARADRERTSWELLHGAGRKHDAASPDSSSAKTGNQRMCQLPLGKVFVEPDPSALCGESRKPRKVELHNFIRLAVQNPGQADEGLRSTRWTLPSAVADAVAVLAQIGACQWHVLHRNKCHVFTPIFPRPVENAHTLPPILHDGTPNQIATFRWMPPFAAKLFFPVRCIGLVNPYIHTIR